VRFWGFWRGFEWAGCSGCGNSGAQQLEMLRGKFLLLLFQPWVRTAFDSPWVRAGHGLQPLAEHPSDCVSSHEYGQLSSRQNALHISNFIFFYITVEERAFSTPSRHTHAHAGLACGEPAAAGKCATCAHRLHQSVVRLL
jgi:hypothetical protein